MLSQKEQIVMEQFDCFCKKVMRNKARDIYREYKRYQARYVSLSSLSSAQLEELSIHESYLVDVICFDIQGVSISVTDDIIAKAIETLPMPSKEIVLMHYFLEMSDTEIAKQLEMKRGTVYYHKKKGMDTIRKYLEVHKDEDE